MAQINVTDLTFCYEGSFDNIFEKLRLSHLKIHHYVFLYLLITDQALQKQQVPALFPTLLADPYLRMLQVLLVFHFSVLVLHRYFPQQFLLDY